MSICPSEVNGSSGVSPEDPEKDLPRWTLARVALWAGGAVAVLGSALILRYGVIEPQAIGQACADTVAPWWCVPRQGLLKIHNFDMWGWGGLIGGALGLVFGWRPAVRMGFVLSLAGLVLYNADLAAVGLVLTCLRLPRVS